MTPECDNLGGNLEEQQCRVVSFTPSSFHLSSHQDLSTMAPVYHKQFDTAGKKPGLQVWRLEKLDLVPVPSELNGDFFTGDSYLILHTTASTPSTSSYKIHTWFGKETSHDEQGSAAIFMIQMDEYLGSSPIQFTEFQDNESTTFLGYFKSGIKYMRGGVASGFVHVVTNDMSMDRLLHIKGRHKIRATEVDMNWESFNKGDCFLIALGKSIYSWCGSESNHFERLKATELAIAYRDTETRGRGEVEIIDEGSEPEEVLKVLGPKPDLPSGSCDKAADKTNKNMATLHLVSDAAGSMKVTKVADKNPFKQDMLSQSECYILDNKGEAIYVWKGKDAKPEERKAALQAANKFIKDNGYAPNTGIQVIPAAGETTFFKQFFHNWLDKDETTGPSQPYIQGKIAKVEKIPFDASKLHENKIMAAQYGMVDDGSGTVEIWRVEDGDKVPVDTSTYGQFFGGDCYLVLYSYSVGGRIKHIIYTWQGQECGKDELTASAFLTVRLDDSMDGVATQVRVTQGQEPAHLVSLFKDKPLVVHLGGTCSKQGESKPGAIRLFHMRRSPNGLTRGVEVNPNASSLNTNDVFVLKSPTSLWIWKGKGGTPEELVAAQHVASLLGGSPTEVEEFNESDEFWEALGGEEAYQTSSSLQNEVRAPRLFACSNKTGRLIAEEVPGELIQTQLASDDVMILDTYDQIYVWVGKDANEVEKTGCSKIAQDYIDSDPSGRNGIPIVTIKQKEEPPCFTGWFLAWDYEMWDKDPLQFLKDLIKRS